MEASRRESRPVRVGEVTIGGGWPIVIQSMTTTSPEDVEGSLRQIASLAAQGCALVRLAVPTPRSLEGLARLRARLREQRLPVALVADVHFQPRLALEASAFVEKVRINPGNFAASLAEADRELARLLPCLASRGVALRIGVNHGSLPPFLVEIHGAGPAGMAETAMEYLRLCCARNFTEVVVSLKASDPAMMVAANRLLAHRMKAEAIFAPIHLGVTEAGEGWEGACRSGVGIGALLLEGIGDTIRVSLTGDPAQEIPICRALLAGVERAGGIGAHASVRVADDRPRARAAQWNELAIGGPHPPRVEASAPARMAGAFRFSDPTAVPTSPPPSDRAAGASPPPSDRVASTSPPPSKASPARGSAVESLLVSLSEEDLEHASLAALAERWRDARSRGLPVWLEMPLDRWAHLFGAAASAQAKAALPLANAEGIALRIRLADLAGGPHAPARNSQARELCDAMRQAGFARRLRLNFDLSTATPVRAQEQEDASRADDEMPRPHSMRADEAAAQAQAAIDFAAVFGQAGLAIEAISCAGPGSSAVLRAIAGGPAAEATRPLLAARMPADSWEAIVSVGALLLDRSVDLITVPVDDRASPAAHSFSGENACDSSAKIALAVDLLHATRRRLARAEFISCPGCGRAPLDLAPTVRRLKARFGHLRDVKMAVMGCSVNGPGEMADADYGYVGAGTNRVDLYAGGRIVARRLTPEQADEALAALLAERGERGGSESERTSPSS